MTDTEYAPAPEKPSAPARRALALVAAALVIGLPSACGGEDDRR